MSAAEEAAATAAAAPFWWAHDSIEHAATPMDPTADDAAAHCLARIAARTADHVRCHTALLQSHFSASSPSSSAVNAVALYDQLEWTPVLVPLLGQLRRSMARAWEERVAEQAEAAAGANAIDAPSITITTAAAVTADGHNGAELPRMPSSSFSPSTPPSAAEDTAVGADPTMLRRLRVVQQRIYLAFLKAFLQGATTGVRAVVTTMASTTNAAAAAGGTTNVTGASDCEADEMQQTARGVAVLLDGLLAHVLVAATTPRDIRAVAEHQTAAGESPVVKPRRAHTHTGKTSALTHYNSAGDDGGGDGECAEGWFTGMMPSYTRAVQHNHEQAAAAAAAAAPTSAGETSSFPSSCALPSLALCLVSYVGVFVRDAGLQLLPAEQAAQLPYFSRAVERTFLRQLTARRVRSLSTAGTTTTQTLSMAERETASVAQIDDATRFLRHVIDTQLYESASGMTAAADDDDDCTPIFATPASLARGAEAASPSTSAAAVVYEDYVVTPLLSLSSYAACSRVVQQLDHWWTLCHENMRREKHVHEEEEQECVKTAGEGQKTEEAAASESPHDTQSNPLAQPAAPVTEAWMTLRRQAMLFIAVLSNYADASLLVPPYTAMLLRLFYPAEEPQLEVWGLCLRDVQQVLRAQRFLPSSGGSRSSTSAAAGAPSAVAMAGSRPLRTHHRHAAGVTFANGSYACSLRLITQCADGGHHYQGVDDAAAVLPLGFSVLHCPLLLLDRVLPATSAGATVSASLCVNTVVGEKLSTSETTTTTSGAAEAASSSATTSTNPAAAVSLSSSSTSAHSARARAVGSAALSGADIVRLSFPRSYRLFHALDHAVQDCLHRAQALTKAAAEGEEEEVGEGAAWVAATALPESYAHVFGSAIDDCFRAAFRNPYDDAMGSALLMFFHAVFHVLPDTDVPCLRAALRTFLGDGGAGLLPFLRRRVVDQHRHGFLAFFLPPLRALGMDFSTCEDTEASLAVAAGPALAYAYELPRLYFLPTVVTPVAEPAWLAQTAAQTFLTALLTPGTADAAAMLDLVREAAVVARARAAATGGHGGSGSGSGAKDAQPRQTVVSHTSSTDIATAFFYAMTRWCTAQLPAPSSPARGGTASAPLIPTAAMISVRALTDVVAALRNPDETQPELPVVRALQARLGGLNAVADAPPATRAIAWIWACDMADVDPAHLQASARRLMRDFTTSFSTQVPVRTLMALRAVVEQRLKADDAAATTAEAGAALLAAVRADLQELLHRQQQAGHEKDKERARDEEASAESVAPPSTLPAPATAVTNEENTESQPAPPGAAPPTTVTPAKTADHGEEEKGKESEKEKSSVPAEAVGPTVPASPPVLAAATLRHYLDALLDALLARCRLSAVDGAVSAAVLPLLLRVLCDTNLPITATTAADRQRLCERFVFTLTGSIGNLTRAETVGALCCLRRVFETLVIPFKKSFLDADPVRRVFHGSLSDSEADAFRMVRHTFGDVVMALQKRTDDGGPGVPSLLDDWKTILLLTHAGPTVCIVRALLEKVRVCVRRRVLQGRGYCIEMMRRRLQQLEHNANAAAAADPAAGLADEVQHLYTLHPPPVTPRPAAVAGPASSASLDSSSQAREGGVGGGRSGGGGGGDDRRRSSRHRGGAKHGGRNRRRDDVAGPSSTPAAPPAAATAASVVSDAQRRSSNSGGGRGDQDRKRSRDERDGGGSGGNGGGGGGTHRSGRSSRGHRGGQRNRRM